MMHPNILKILLQQDPFTNLCPSVRASERIKRRSLNVLLKYLSFRWTIITVLTKLGSDNEALMEPELKRGIKLMWTWKGINKKHNLGAAAATWLIIIFSVSVRESKSSLDSLKSGHKIAQTQTEKKISFLQQFRYCFMGNEKYRYITFMSLNVPFATYSSIIERIVRKKLFWLG